ncbi:uncharacterized protein LOC110991757 isoform X1 [Pieris rapae]|uniref:uncharacterized protein LOC110991757 isoform X1 n=1 Tax=Pieris rapae TaxID=64459 RepID=UPI001E27C712|nr:uncharacterized protein LOC110991757 isoform X1 [Pieris rapae]
MVQRYLLLLSFLSASCFLDNVSSRPSNNESAPLKVEIPVETTTLVESEGKHPVYYHPDANSKVTDDTRDIIDKINSINTGLEKPNGPKKHRYKIHTTGGTIVVDIDQLQKLQDEYENNEMKKAEINALQKENESIKRYLYAKEMKMGQNKETPMPPLPYLMNIPVIVMPQGIDLNNRFNFPSNLNSIATNDIYQTRQNSPSFPSFPTFPSFSSFPFQNFQFQWPFAQLFPFIIKDPYQTFSQGGSWNNLFEYGQNADVCSRKQKSVDESSSDTEENLNELSDINSLQEVHTRQERALKKRTISNRATHQQINDDKKGKKIYVTKPVTTSQKKTTKKPYVVEELEEVKNEESGDLRFPFGDFGWFGNKKPVAPSPGFFINKLRVRKGGVAIAGPGGVATAGRGGTAIVGPGGLAYTQPGGLAVAGPAARVVALSSDADLHSLISRLQQDNDGSVPRSKQPIREGKVVATGPVVYYHPNEQTST